MEIVNRCGVHHQGETLALANNDHRHQRILVLGAKPPVRSLDYDLYRGPGACKPRPLDVSKSLKSLNAVNRFDQCGFKVISGIQGV